MVERVAMIMFVTCFASGLLPGGRAIFSTTNTETGFTFIVFESATDETGSWYDARAQCRTLSQSVELAEIVAPSDVTTVRNLLTNSQASPTSFWLGIYDHASEMEFKTLYNGSTLPFSNWDGGRPKSDANKNCGTLVSSSSLWRDEECTGPKMRGILCRKLAQNPPPSMDPNTGCPPTAVPFDGLCYDFQLLGMGNFSEARQACEAHPSGQMVVPNSQAEAEFVRLYAMLTGKAEFWLGITDEYLDDVPRSVYGPDLIYHNWHHTGMGANPSEIDCALVDSITGIWFLDFCTEQKGIMCAVVPASQASTQGSTQAQTSTFSSTVVTSTDAPDNNSDVSRPTSTEGAPGPRIENGAAVTWGRKNNRRKLPMEISAKAFMAETRLQKRQVFHPAA